MIIKRSKQTMNDARLVLEYFELAASFMKLKKSSMELEYQVKKLQEDNDTLGRLVIHYKRKGDRLEQVSKHPHGTDGRFTARKVVPVQFTCTKNDDVVNKRIVPIQAGCANDFTPGKLEPVLEHQDREVLVGTLFNALLQTDQIETVGALIDHKLRVDYYIQKLGMKS